jgi:hypothetical protein
MTPHPKSVVMGVVTDTQPPVMTDHVLIVSLQQSQDHQMSVDLSEGTVHCLRGPLDMIKWKELHVVHDTIRAAVVRAGLAPPDSLKCEPYLVKTATGWNPVLDLWGRISPDQDFEFEKIRLVVEAVLAGLKRDLKNDADDLFVSALKSSEREAVHQVITEALSLNGGKKLAVPVHMSIKENVLTLIGKLGAKPRRANFHPTEVPLHGRFSGFDLEKNELIFRTPGKCVLMNFEPSLVDLISVTRAATEGRELVVRTHKTIARDGREDHAYLPDEPFKSLSA